MFCSNVRDTVLVRQEEQEEEQEEEQQQMNKPSLNAAIDEMNTYSASAISLQSSSVRFSGGTISFLTSSGMVM